MGTGLEDKQNNIDNRLRWVGSTKRVVVKIGSALIASGGTLEKSAVRRLAGDIAELRRRGIEVIVVSSGAIASGLRALGLQRMPKAIVDKQAAAAVGQQVLMGAWSEAFAKHRLVTAQVLLTAADLDHRKRYLNARHTLLALLNHGVVPIINENDSVAFDEIKMGDNDHLSALVTTCIAADLLVLLTGVPGLLQGGPGGEVIPEVAAGDDIDAHIRSGRSATGVGGMATKVASARLVGDAGVPAVIAPGDRKGVLGAIVAGERVGTLFTPQPRKMDTRRRWLATATRSRGAILVDAGAKQAIVERKASLLPSGIIRVEGRFDAGAVVKICDAKGDPFARGLAAYASDEIDRVRGRKGAELPSLLGYRYLDEIVHRNDLVVDVPQTNGG